MSQAHIQRMTGRNHWVENLRCPQRGRTGTAELSTVDSLSWAVQMDITPNGFKVIEFDNSSNFYCDFCDRPVEP